MFTFTHVTIDCRYNEIHIRTRQTVERAFGAWKRRFPCLARGLTTKLLCSTSIVVACAVLHNMSLIFNDVLPDEENEIYVDEEMYVPNEHNFHAIDGFAAREALINRMFG